MSDLLLMSPPGLPRTGLVGLWDPYRDVYGRNVSTTTTAGMYREAMTEASGTFLETSATAVHTCGITYATIALYQMSVKITPIGRKRFMIGQGSTTAWALFDTTTVAVIAQGEGCTSASIVANGDGTYTLTGSLAVAMAFVYPMPDDATGNTSRSFAGDTSKGFTLNQWQVNLGPVLHPYSAPAGAPGTLQTSLDYSGNGNNLTLGATTNASTDDPTNTGTAWSFDGGDYLTGNNTDGGAMTSYTVFRYSSGVRILSRNNVLLWQSTGNKLNLSFRNTDGASTDVTTAAGFVSDTWYLVVTRLSTAGEASIAFADVGSMAATGKTLDTTYTSYGNYLARSAAAGFYFGGYIAYHARYNWVHPDNLAMRCRNSIKSLMAPRGIAL